MLSQHFSRDGISISWPSDWVSEATAGPNDDWSITITSPSSAFLQLYHISGGYDQDSLIKEIVNLIQSDYTSTYLEPITITIGKSPAIGYALHFLTLDQLVTCQAVVVEAVYGTLAIVIQHLDNESLARMQQLFSIISSITIDT